MNIQGGSLKAKHVMIDIEALGTSPRAPLLALGAVAIDASGRGLSSFYRAVKPSLSPPYEPGFGTLVWWTQQSEEARAVFSDPNAVGADIFSILFTRWWGEHADENTKLWAKPPRFDVAILEHTLRHYVSIPWGHRNVLCFRTLIHLKDPKGVCQPPFIGVEHNALSDAERQANYLVRLLNSSGL